MWRGGISPPRYHRSVREPLDSHGSCQPFSKNLTVLVDAESNSAPPSCLVDHHFRELAHPLRSSPITGPSTLILDDPPLCLALALSFSWGLHLNFSLNIEATGSHVPRESLDRSHAIFMPEAAQAVSRYPPEVIPGLGKDPGFDPTIKFRHLIDGSFSLVSLIHTSPRS